MARVHPRRWFPERVNLDALRIAYGDLAALAVSLDEDASWRPTACAGWAVRDLVHHLLGDAQRALVALATPSSGPVDRDSTTYGLIRREHPTLTPAASAPSARWLASGAWSI